MVSEADTAPLSPSQRPLQGEPQVSSSPLLARDLLQREVAGAPPEQAVLPGLAAATLMETRQGESYIDQSSRAAAVIASLRSERKSSFIGDQSLTAAISDLLPSILARGLADRLPSVASLRDSIKTLLQRTLAPATPFQRKGHEELERHNTDIKQVQKQKKALEEEDEALQPQAKFTNPLTDKKKSTLSLLTSLSQTLMDGLRFVWKICSEAISAVGRFIKGLKEPLPKSPTFTPSETAAPESSPFLNTKAKSEVPLEWKERFGDDPAEEVKKSAKTIQEILDELALEELREEQEEDREKALDEQHHQERLNQLRDALAKLLTPLSNGTIPVQFLSRHFVGPWVTTEDLMHAIRTARSKEIA